MRSEKTRKFNGRTYRVSDLKEGPYKKKLVKGLMSARRDVGTALKKKIKKWSEELEIVSINLRKS